MKLNLSRDTLSENAKRQRSRQASSAGATTSSFRPMGGLLSLPFATAVNAEPTATDRLSCLNRASQILQALLIERSNPGTGARMIGISVPALACYGDARLLAQ